jgi:hypothetical protein
LLKNGQNPTPKCVAMSMLEWALPSCKPHTYACKGRVFQLVGSALDAFSIWVRRVSACSHCLQYQREKPFKKYMWMSTQVVEAHEFQCQTLWTQILSPRTAVASHHWSFVGNYGRNLLFTVNSVTIMVTLL